MSSYQPKPFDHVRVRRYELAGTMTPGADDVPRVDVSGLVMPTGAGDAFIVGAWVAPGYVFLGQQDGVSRYLVTEIDVEPMRNR